VDSMDSTSKQTINTAETVMAGTGRFRNGREKGSNRRQFLERATLMAGSMLLLGSSAAGAPGQARPRTPRASKRADEAFELRMLAAREQCLIESPRHACNGDEQRYQNRIGNFSKGLPHNQLGEAEPAAYESLTHALKSGKPEDFEKIWLGGDRRLVNPQAGMAFEMRGPDSHGLHIKPAPAFASAEEAAEIAENYWMALTRDIPFSAYHNDPLIQRAAEDLSRFSEFHGPKIDGKVMASTLFRGKAPGCLEGPYLSQFLALGARYGTEYLDRRIHTVSRGVDYVTDYDEWLSIQNGNSPWPDQYDPVPRYICSGRDLGHWVHYDVLFQAFLDALLVLFHLGAQRDPLNPYVSSKTQSGFVTLGSVHVAALLGGVSTPALKATWFQKWFVHRRLRPEEFAGRIHNHMTKKASYPIHGEILQADALEAAFDKNKTYLLPQEYPEGSPTHPAYGAGHATVAGACTTVLKAFFEESFVVRGTVEASADGLSLAPYEGKELTVGGELNKLAYNIGIGRNIAGVHWRSDAEESLKLGEQVAIQYLKEERNCLRESFRGFALTKFDGSKIMI
jgi:hypothetical protein